MDWARILAYVTGTVDQELLARNEYLVAENRILKAHLKAPRVVKKLKRPRAQSVIYRQYRGSGRPVRYISMDTIADGVKGNRQWIGLASWPTSQGRWTNAVGDWANREKPAIRTRFQIRSVTSIVVLRPAE
jgi:hypothetical protein